MVSSGVCVAHTWVRYCKMKHTLLVYFASCSSSRASMVKEVSEFVLKRLEHNSPIVKQKVQFTVVFGLCFTL